jgi:hypothetical protein
MPTLPGDPPADRSARRKGAVREKKQFYLSRDVVKRLRQHALSVDRDASDLVDDWLDQLLPRYTISCRSPGADPQVVASSALRALQAAAG